ncbi:tRNA-(ms[2]io[6]A)-hydroxylase [Stigmatella aurantiaca]|uniref:tRNA-(Ms[2]io[6]A)-hydroxylase n=1 Tax=Stigmatella aurantiaca TaxID=41 RepID=A0A1H7PAJ7_STIAU|nr:tRNA isopentenyl-2-thiomethyl-A-37 hydroxylase MiaE [Stigmatella aurantiaca]SEL32669.1 tRNA-(ms[2]io[6]A)-hydroxylase [Stigmatella aurantiaca]
MDRLLVAAIIEARSCERLSLLAEGLEDPALRRFYGELAQSEDGHQSLFYRPAVTASGDEAAVKARLKGHREAETLHGAPPGLGDRWAYHILIRQTGERPILID